jgi:hypothetical protein
MAGMGGGVGPDETACEPELDMRRLSHDNIHEKEDISSQAGSYQVIMRRTSHMFSRMLTA